MPGPNEEQSELASITDAEEFDLQQLELEGSEQELEVDEAAATRAAEVEAEATRSGWVPKDKFKGDPKTWVDAQTFVARGERIATNLSKEVARLKAKLESFEGTRKQFVKFHEETIAAKDKEIADAIRTLRVQKSEATSEGEHEAAVNLEDRIETLKAEQAALKAAEQKSNDPVSDPIMDEWIAEGNEWFQKDGRMRAYALALGEELLRDGETLRGREFLDKVTDLMAEEFPAKFGKSAPAPRARATAESSRSATASAPVGRGARDLPAADRALMKEFVDAGWTSEAEFLKSYWARNN